MKLSTWEQSQQASTFVNVPRAMTVFSVQAYSVIQPRRQKATVQANVHSSAHTRAWEQVDRSSSRRPGNTSSSCLQGKRLGLSCASVWLAAIAHELHVARSALHAWSDGGEWRTAQLWQLQRQGNFMEGDVLLQP
jgi:hypothetical protein